MLLFTFYPHKMQHFIIQDGLLGSRSWCHPGLKVWFRQQGYLVPFRTISCPWQNKTGILEIFWLSRYLLKSATTGWSMLSIHSWLTRITRTLQIYRLLWGWIHAMADDSSFLTVQVSTLIQPGSQNIKADAVSHHNCNDLDFPKAGFIWSGTAHWSLSHNCPISRLWTIGWARRAKMFMNVFL